MKKNISLLVLLIFIFLSAQAQQSHDFLSLAHFFQKMGKFDYTYPREQVYVQLDNQAYFENETMWFKAYVLRASTLQARPLSKVLYVELLNADGVTIERKLCKIDSLGQAEGQFELKLPIRAGYYEVRAYTREMVNWGTNACFSRVVPVFKKNKNPLNFNNLSLNRPYTEKDMMPGHERKILLESTHKVRLSFYPEGGERVRGVIQRIAYQLTDGRGKPLKDTINVYAEDNQLVATSIPLHEGMGIFTLPANVENGYVKVRKKKIRLPDFGNSPYALMAHSSREGKTVVIQKNKTAKKELLGLVVMCRGKVCYFDTLTVGNEPVELDLSNSYFHGGVNRIDLFNTKGQSYASRLVWKDAKGRDLKLKVEQNLRVYNPFSPVALRFSLKNQQGVPVESVFSISVRDKKSNLVANNDVNLSADLLLASEVRGYVHAPGYYFQANNPSAHEALDLLLMVQGWRANSLSVMDGAKPFRLSEPIEDKLTLNGFLYKDNEKRIPLKGFGLHLKMYSPKGQGRVLEGNVTTDSLGRFAMVSNLDFYGNWIAYFTTTTPKGKKKWSRIALDRWYNLPPHSFGYEQLELSSPQPETMDSQNLTATHIPETLFAWQDTIPNTLKNVLHTAKVIARKGYIGFVGNRYTYMGGENAGLERASYFYNIEQEMEKREDKGEDVGLLWDLLAKLNPKITYYPADTFLYRNTSPAMFENNYQNDSLWRKNIWPEEIKSVVVMENYNNWIRYVKDPSKMVSDKEYAFFVYNRPDHFYFNPKKGLDRRFISGYSRPMKFYSPNYRQTDLPTEKDVRRTLYWNPSVRTNQKGEASVVFFSNCSAHQQLSISVKGITPLGQFINYEQ